MPSASAPAPWQQAIVLLAGTVVSVVVIAALYWAQVVFVPVAASIFLTFLLSPLVRRLQGVGLGRIPAVLLVVLLASALIGGVVWVVGNQLKGLADELPGYSANLQAKARTLRDLAAGGTIERLQEMIQGLNQELQTKEGPPGEGNLTPGEHPDGTPPLAEPGKAQPTPVVVRSEKPFLPLNIPNYVGSAVEVLGGLALTVVLVIFMLLNREDLRNRFLGVTGGRARLTATTRAVDDAGQRISRYLVAQAIVNGTYGLAVAAGLFVLGIDYALLWGFLAAVLRYVPYIGPWVAALFPIALSLAMFADWWHPLAVIGFFLVLELVSNNFMEPWLYGRSMGVSEVALLVAAAFWTFLWGPVGLVLSAPLTVCLVVLGKYVPQLAFLDVLLGDEPALEPDQVYYQRLLARDQDEAEEVVTNFLAEHPAEEVFDAVLVPALSHLRRDADQDNLVAEDARFMRLVTREVVEDVVELLAQEKPQGGGSNGDGAPAEPSDGSSDSPRGRILVCAARDENDLLALEMLAAQLGPQRWDVQIAPLETLAAELVERVRQEEYALVCIASLPPGGLAHTRYLVKRLRSRHPQLHIVVGRWGETRAPEAVRERLQQCGATAVTFSLRETRDYLQSLLPVLGAHEPGPVRERGAVVDAGPMRPAVAPACSG